MIEFLLIVIIIILLWPFLLDIFSYLIEKSWLTFKALLWLGLLLLLLGLLLLTPSSILAVIGSVGLLEEFSILIYVAAVAGLIFFSSEGEGFREMMKSMAEWLKKKQRLVR